MTTATIAQSARTQIAAAAAGLNSLASGAYVTIGTITHNSSGKVPLDCMVEVLVNPGSVSGNKQAVLFAQASLDGTNYSSGPSSGTTTTDEQNLIFVGVLPLNTTSGAQRKIFSLAAAMPGMILPFASRLIVKNDSGAAFASTGNDAYMLNDNGDLT